MKATWRTGETEVQLYLFPFGDQGSICVALAQAEIVEVTRNTLLAVEHIIDEAAALVMHLEDRPKHLVATLAIVGIALG